MGNHKMKKDNIYETCYTYGNVCIADANLYFDKLCNLDAKC